MFHVTSGVFFHVLFIRKWWDMWPNKMQLDNKSAPSGFEGVQSGSKGPL